MSEGDLTPADTDDDDRRLHRAAMLHVAPPLSSAPSWVLTYADIVAQLNCLLILMLTFAHFVPSEFQQLRGSVEHVFGAAADNSGQTEAPPPEETATPTQNAAIRETGLVNGLRAMVARHGGRLQGGNVEIEVFEDYRGVTLRMGQAALFDRVETAVRPAAWLFLDSVGDLMDSEATRLEVEVRVPRSLVSSGVDPTWFAGRRGTQLVKYLLGRDRTLDPARLAIRAIGDSTDTNPLPASTGRATADRIDFVFSRATAQAEAPP